MSTVEPAIVETHVSVLFFHEDVVLKVKKPVHYPFVDFRSLEARRRACEEEVRCNRRLAPDVYLGVAETRLGEQVLDHAVVMRRLPAERCLEALVRRRDPVVDVGLEQVATQLASFHREAARSSEIDADGDLPAVLATWDGLVDSLASFAGSAFGADDLADADRLAQRFLRARRPLFAQRIGAGRVCDGHGDLLAADVFLLDDGPRILDAIEFDERLRHGDVAADVAFLAMDLERLGAPEEARRFVVGYQQAAHDTFPPSLLHYYCAERAMVRALVTCLRDGGHRSEASALVDLALTHLRTGRVVLGVVSGLPGTGKSTVAAAVGRRLQWPVLRSDEVRLDVLGAPADSPLTAAFGQGPYRTEETDRTYEALLSLAGRHLRLGQSVILDAGFRDDRWRGALQRLADDASAELVVVETATPPGLAAARAEERLRAGGDVSGAGRAVVVALAEDHRTWPAAVLVDTSGSDPAPVVARVQALFELRHDAA